MTYPDEIECTDCDGNGWTPKVWYFGLRPHKTEETCTVCAGTGWRAPTDDERDKIEWELNQ